MSESLQLHGLQLSRFPCPSLSPGVYSHSCALSWWCYLTTSSSATLFSSCLQSFPASGGKRWLFPNESSLHIRWSKHWSFSFSISPTNEYSGLISSKIDWLDLLTVYRTLKSLLQQHNSKASILWHSAFMVQLSHLCMTTGKIIALTMLAQIMLILIM